MANGNASSTDQQSGPSGSQPSDSVRPSTVFVLLVLVAVIAGLIVLVYFLGSNGTQRLDITIQTVTIVIAFLFVLGCLTALFSYLQLGAKTEAFGLPSGTIRAVIAVGLLVAFVAFAVGQLDRLSKGSLTPETVTVPKSELFQGVPDNGRTPQLLTQRVNERRQALGQQGLVVLGANENVDPVQIYILRPTPDRDWSAFAREVMTMLGTLLTSVVSFYFGTSAVVAGSQAVRNVIGSRVGVPPTTLTSSTIGFEDGNAITDTGAGLGIFSAGDIIAVSGSSRNDGMYTVATVVPGRIEIEAPGSTKAEPPGAKITITKQA